MITMFVNEYLRIQKYCADSPFFDRGIFMTMHDNYSKAWKKLSMAEQGEISYRLDSIQKKG